MTRAAKVCAVIVTWNGRHLLDRLLESLMKSDWSGLHIVVVDNASADDTVAMMKNKYPSVEPICLKENIGYSAGINVGIERAKSIGPDYVWVFNNDVVTMPDCLEKLVEIMDKHPDVGVAGPMVLDFKTGKIAHAGYRISLMTGRMTELAAPPDSIGFYQVDSAFGCSNLIRMKVVEQIGGFDPGFNVYFDETDFNVRAGRAGWKVIVAPEARVYHEESATMNKMLPRKAWLLLRNLMKFELKHATAAQLTVFIPYFFLIHIPQFIARGLWYAYNVRKGAQSR